MNHWARKHFKYWEGLRKLIWQYSWIQQEQRQSFHLLTPLLCLEQRREAKRLWKVKKHCCI